MSPPNIVPPWASDRQQFLLGKLNEKNARLHIQYLGALMVLRDEANPDRIALAGHGLRELSEHLMREVGIERMRYNLGSEVNNLREPWKEVEEEARSCSGVCGSCAGKKLSRFLQRLSEFFMRDTLNRPKAKERMASAIEQIDVNRKFAGSDSLGRATDRWQSLHDFFNDCAHHHRTTLDDLHAKLFAFEELLIELLLPSPSGDMLAIEEILAKENVDA